ncbi:hypothetical protein DSO57_1032466 [Entomophthora muscae]|uniref:Uncharacterized protein n=1 Tax=Entomophthora muscae TaxID=34485 RepID=A0ACC2SDP8_9FUNG|nr:hypothetical protein DSO57_1032466 [Entomophthora muscae]
MVENLLAIHRLVMSSLARENLESEAIYCLCLFCSVPLTVHLFFCVNQYAHHLKDNIPTSRGYLPLPDEA